MRGRKLVSHRGRKSHIKVFPLKYYLYSSLNSSNHQTTNDAYHGNWAFIHVDRGHLNPNEAWPFISLGRTYFFGDTNYLRQFWILVTDLMSLMFCLTLTTFEYCHQRLVTNLHFKTAI